MKIKVFIAALLLMGGLATQLAAQNVKIGYANVELLIAYMDETKAMQQQVQTYENQLAQRLRTKQEYAQTKFAEYQERAQAGATEQDLMPLQQELEKLQQELQQEQAEAQQKAMTKRQELMAPITAKVSKAIKEVADAEGYTLVLNTTDGSGTSIVLHGPEEHDLTRKLVDKLGIKIPEQGN